MNSDSLIDIINELKLENADLRRRLLTTPSPPNDSSEALITSCRLCPVLEKQNSRLHEELDEARVDHSRKTTELETTIFELRMALSREFERRTRMEQIIIRQKSYIQDCLREGDYSSGYSSDSDVHTSPGFDNGREPRTQSKSICGPRIGPVPHWDVDMDDLSRQLHELNESLRRVDDHANRLNSTANSLREPRGTVYSQGTPSLPSSGTLLANAMSGIGRSACSN